MSSKSTLMILPGLLCDETVFADQVSGLSDICTIQSTNFRGFDSLESMARHVLDIAPPTFALAGFSMGGRVAFQIMRLAPERVERLCLFDTGAAAEPEGGAAARKPLVDLAYKEGMEALANTWLPPMLGKSRRNDKAFQKPIVEMICRSTPEDHEKQIKALVSRPDATPLLATIKCPTLVLCGEDDAFTTPSVHAQMTAAIPGAQLTIIPDAGHFVSVEQPALFNAALRSWLTK